MVALDDRALPAKLTLNPEWQMNDDEYYYFCMANPEVRFERTARGEIVIVPPAGGESDYQCGQTFLQLATWAERDGRGKPFTTSAEFTLPSGAALSPDAAWVSNRRLAQLSREQKRKFLPVCPEFVIEVMSPSDRLRAARKKMEEWMLAGIELAWLIQPDEKTVYIYRAGQDAPEQRAGISSIGGDGPVAGFELDLTKIWAGL